MQRFITWLTTLLLRSKRLKGDHKTRIMSVLLDNLHAIPVNSIMQFNRDGTMLINGRSFDYEQAMAFREGVIVLKNSNARKIINDQLTYEAINLGIHQGLTPEQIQFSKAVLWIIQEEQKLIDSVTTE